MFPLSKPLVLGSKSPRRSELLGQLGFEFECFTVEVDESYPADLDLKVVAEYIAKKKSMEIFDLLQRDVILLTADCIVVLENTVYGKPKDKSDAIETLKALSAKTHTVFSGVCIRSRDKEVSFTVASEVTFGKLTDEEIEYYLEKDKPYDKAGSYGIQDWIGLGKVEKINGSYSNIVGLPTREVYEALYQFM